MPARSSRGIVLRYIGCAALLVTILGCGTTEKLIAPAGGTATGPVAAVTATPAPSPTPIPTPTATPIPVAEALSSNTFKLPLTIQHVTSTSAELYFELSAPMEGVVTYQSEAGGEQVVPFDASSAAHQIGLNDLLPGVTYRAAVDVKDSDGLFHHPGFASAEWGDVSFRTWADKEPIRFGIVGDSGFGDPVTPKIAAQMASANLDFTLQVGDIVYNINDNKDVFEAFALKYYGPFAPVLRQMPMYLVLGNHDDEDAALWNGAPFYDHAFPPFPDPLFPDTPGSQHDWYAFAYGNVQFLMLNSEGLNNSKERQDQKVWLAERLADPRFTTSIPVFHVAPYSAGAHVNDGEGIRADWVPLFQQAGVKLVLSGHDHNYQRLIENNITYIVSGGGSATLYAQTTDVPGSQVFNQISHFVIFDVYPDRIDIRAVALGGSVIDTATVALK